MLWQPWSLGLHAPSGTACCMQCKRPMQSWSQRIAQDGSKGKTMWSSNLEYCILWYLNQIITPVSRSFSLHPTSVATENIISLSAIVAFSQLPSRLKCSHNCWLVPGYILPLFSVGRRALKRTQHPPYAPRSTYIYPPNQTFRIRIWFQSSNGGEGWKFSSLQNHLLHLLYNIIEGLWWF